MTTSVTREEAAVTPVDHQGVEIVIREYIGKMRELQRGPQAFSVTSPTGWVNGAHYHLSDQCQVFVDGSATVGTHETDPVTLHYTDAYTPYGPIDPGPEGYTYINVRARHDVGSERMPEARKSIQRHDGREIVAHCRLSLADDVEILRLETLIDLQDDGLAAYELAAAPGARLPEAPAGGNGRFQLVLDGSLECGGKTLTRHSVGFVEPGDIFGRRTAGPAGAHVVEIQFPRE